MTAAVTITAALALLAGCSLSGNAADLGSRRHSSSPAPSSAPASPHTSTSAPGSTLPAPTGLRRYYHQRVTWTRCGGGFQCARVVVPVDYRNPTGATLRLAVIKRLATEPGSKVGSLLVNPGGPGASGVSYVRSAGAVFGAPLLRHYDIIGFDPRGVGRSDPIDCVSDSRLDTFLGADPDPDTPAEVARNARLYRSFTSGCQRHSGQLLAHVSTEEAARDMDVLRAVVGSPKLDYLGASYGTYLGAVYAGLFPHKVGRMVLDGAIDPAQTPRQAALIQARGFQTALRAYVTDCVSQPDCPLGGTVDAGLAKLHQFLDSLDRHPLPGDGQNRLTQGWAFYGLAVALYEKSLWPYLTQALQTAFAGNGSVLLQLAYAYVRRVGGSYQGNLYEAIYAINCLDHPEHESVAEIEHSIPTFEKASPTFGSVFAWGSYACSNWPVKSDAKPAPIHAKGAAPIVVIGTTRDPATPVEEARALASELDSGVLVLRNGDGHTGYHQGNACVDNAVESYLVDGTVPKDGLTC